METANLLDEKEFKSLKYVRELCNTETVKMAIPPELEARYIATFINNNIDTWAEVKMFHSETRKHFKEYKQSRVERDGTSWLYSDNFWD